MSSLLSSAEMWLNNDDISASNSSSNCSNSSSGGGGAGDRSKNIIPSGAARTLAVAAATNVFAASGTGVNSSTTTSTITTQPTPSTRTVVELERQQQQSTVLPTATSEHHLRNNSQQQQSHHHSHQNLHSQTNQRDNLKEKDKQEQQRNSLSFILQAGQISAANMAKTTASIESESIANCSYIDEAQPQANSSEQTVIGGGLKNTNSNENQNIRLHRLARSIRGKRPDLTRHLQQHHQQQQQQQQQQPPPPQPQSQQQASSKGVVDKLVESVNGIDLEDNIKLDASGTITTESAVLTSVQRPAEPPKQLRQQPQQQDLKPQLQPQPQQQQHNLRQPTIKRQYQQRYSPVAHRRTNFTDPNESRLSYRQRKEIRLNKMEVPDHLIEAKYLVEKDTTKGGFLELGSGQFGKVYAAISEYKPVDTADKSIWSGVPVAIKEISKARFDLRQQAKLKNEANILSGLDHPGVIILERVHDLPDKIYIVMEQLEDDMLEMIMSTPEKRLNERVTKFLTYQILEALKYLHAQKIAHCDLKPENVLLVDKHIYPQVKLCDFGFAKIIEENSFRSSLVGTPAYLAPEVVKGERYNRSVDLWSVGVIVYVSLSGEFPFNEGENIHDQISRANFMYPKEIWKNVSQQAMSFINSLLRVNCEKRLSANTAQMDIWIQDFQLWCDLCDLELRIGKRWVTDDADYDRWSRYAKENGYRIPSSAVQLHMDLDYD